MRILHTSDWHLGQEFHGFAREAEHEAFLAWLIEQLEAQAVDALLVTGDIYDSQNPPISAQKQLYRFISAARRRLPRLDIVLVGGNHDSAGRLEAPGPLLEEFGVRVVGSLPRGEDGALDPDRLVLPLRDRAGKVAALCVAVPFLRLPDLPPAAEDDGEDRLIAGVRAIYETALAEAAAMVSPGQSLVVTGHCFMTGAEVSDLSERRIFGGNQQALPVSLFPESVTYVALGHLHKAQRVGGRDAVRYCGSPLPLSVTERAYHHQVILVDLDGPSALVTPLMVPRAVEIVRVPARGAAPPAEVLAALRLLEADPKVPRAVQPYLDVVVALSEPAPGLRRDIDEALAGKGVRLARLKAESAGVVVAQPDAPIDLETLSPEEVFVQCWRRAHADGPPDAYLGAFRELLHAVEGGQ
jgi:exonuclease SbcD